MFTAEVRINLKKGVVDPEGKNTKKALDLLGFEVLEVHSSKVFSITINAQDKEQARKEVESMCRRLLANPVIHDYHITIG